MMIPEMRTVERSSRTLRPGAAPPALVTPSACTPADTGVGQCFGQNGPIPGSFNCAACCALRGAVSWQNPNIGAAAVC